MKWWETLSNIAAALKHVLVSDRKLAKQIDGLDRFYDHMGDLGTAFKEAAEGAKPRESVMINPSDSAAHYISFSSYETRGHLIEYGEESFKDDFLLLRTRFHEMTHVFQTQNSVICCVSPFNEASRAAGIMVSPLTYLKTELLQEQDTAAKENWLICKAINGFKVSEQEARSAGYLSAVNILQGFSSFEAFMQRTSESYIGPEETEEEMEQYVLSLIAGTTLQVNQAKDGDSLYHYYMHHALDNYEGFVRQMEAGEGIDPDIVIVEGERDDYIEIGNSFGPNPFVSKKGKLLGAFNDQFSELPADIVARIKDLNERIGYNPRKDRITLNQALKDRGISRSDFLERARPKPRI